MGIEAPAEVKYGIIYEAVKLDNNLLNISMMCRIAGVSRSGYYSWLESADYRQACETQDARDFELVLDAYRFRGRPKGARSIYMRLLHTGIRMNLKKIRRLMGKFGLKCPVRGPNPYRQMAKALKTNSVFPNVVNREFHKSGPRHILLTDITYLFFVNGKCYLSTILDAVTREVLAYQVSLSFDVTFVLETLDELQSKYGAVLDNSTIVHSDQGCHYTSRAFIEKLKEFQFVQSMSRKGNCWDNAPQESFFGHFKDEVRDWIANCKTFEEVKLAVDDQMDYYNNDRYQKNILLQYAREHRFPNPVFFVDDGYSGTNFERPGFQQMLAEIEAGHVSICLSKDLSRLGRNSSLVGLYTSMTFPKYGVCYIAINDNFDSADPNSVNNDFAGIKNWFNEFYARDTSRKIRAVQKAKGERGEPLTVNVPYGYKKDPENPKHWIVDPEAAAVVKHIFDLCMEGRGPSQIANQLRAEKIVTPTVYQKMQGRNCPNPEPEEPFAWGDSTVVHILERREYTGCTVNFKTYSNSIWDKKQRENPEENWAVFYDTHERIIDDDVFEKVQEIRQKRHRTTRHGRSSIFSGMVYCADCGALMNYGSSNNRDFSQDFFDCSVHRKNKKKCCGHFIRVKVLEQLVLKNIQMVTNYIYHYEDYFRTAMEKQLQIETSEKIKVNRRQLERNTKRIADLKRLFIKIYEDNAIGKLSDERYEMLSQTYETEQKQLEAELVTLKQEIEAQEQQIENIEQFIQKANRYVSIEELTPYALHELISAIYVSAPDKSTGKRRQSIHIKYDGLGFIPLDELLQREKA